MQKYGVTAGGGDARVYDFSVLKKSFAIQEVKESVVKVADDRMPSIIDQGPISSCVACALAALLEYFEFIENGEYGNRLSHPYIYGKHRAKDSTGYGMFVETALKSMMNCGTVPMTVWQKAMEMPEIKQEVWDRGDLEKIAEATKIGGYCKIRFNSADELCESIRLAIKNTNAPLVATSNYAFGENHCVLIYGVDVDKKEVFVQNSWGETWGTRGRGRMPASDFDHVYMVMDEQTAIPFKDVPEDAWYYKAVANMYRAGYLNGKDEGTFDPDGYVRRSELAQVLNKILKNLDEINEASRISLERWIKIIEEKVGLI